MECAVDDPDYKNESNFINSLMQKSGSGIKGLILSITHSYEGKEGCAG